MLRQAFFNASPVSWEGFCFFHLSLLVCCDCREKAGECLGAMILTGASSQLVNSSFRNRFLRRADHVTRSVVRRREPAASGILPLNHTTRLAFQMGSISSFLKHEDNFRQRSCLSNTSVCPSKSNVFPSGSKKGPALSPTGSFAVVLSQIGRVPSDFFRVSDGSHFPCVLDWVTFLLFQTGSFL